MEELYHPDYQLIGNISIHLNTWMNNMQTNQKMYDIGNIKFKVIADNTEDAEHQVIHFLRQAFREYGRLYGLEDYEWTD